MLLVFQGEHKCGWENPRKVRLVSWFARNTFRTQEDIKWIKMSSLRFYIPYYVRAVKLIKNFAECFYLQSVSDLQSFAKCFYLQSVNQSIDHFYQSFLLSSLLFRCSAMKLNLTCLLGMLLFEVFAWGLGMLEVNQGVGKFLLISCYGSFSIRISLCVRCINIY